MDLPKLIIADLAIKQATSVYRGKINMVIKLFQSCLKMLVLIDINMVIKLFQSCLKMLVLIDFAQKFCGYRKLRFDDRLLFSQYVELRLLTGGNKLNKVT